MTEPLEVNGTQPRIEGHVCEELLAEEYSHAGEVTAPANVVHLRFSGRWYRLYFDFGVVFWRESQERPTQYELPELQAEVHLIDLAARYDVGGRLLERVEARAIRGGSEVVFHFAGSRRVHFTCIDDHTSHAA